MSNEINQYYPRQIGEFFLLVSTRDNTFLKVNETVYDFVSSFRGGECDRKTVLTKYDLTPEAYDKCLADIARGLSDA